MRDSSRQHAPWLNAQQSQALWEATTDAVLVLDRQSIIRHANPAFEAMFGYQVAEVIGQPISLVQPERLRAAHLHGLDRYLQSGKRSLDWSSAQACGLRKDGTEFPLEISFTQLEVDGQLMFAGFLRDITVRRRTEDERVRAQGMQAALYKISEAAHSAPDLDGLFHAIHQIISELLPARNFYVALYDQATDMVSFPYWVDELDERPEPRALSDRRGLTGLVIKTGEPLLLSPDTIQDVASRPDVTTIGSDGVDWLGIPLKTSRGTIGVLTVQNYTGDSRYTERDKELLQFVSDQVAAAVERKQAQQAVLDSEQRFHSVFDQSPIIICLLSYPDGQFQEMNAAGIAAFGYRREEMLGRTSLELKAWADPEERQRYQQLMQRDGAVKNFESRMRRRDGTIFTVLSSGSLVTLSGRTFSLNSLQDISDRKRAEQWQTHYADTLAMITAEAPITEVFASLARFAEQQVDGAECSIEVLAHDGQPASHLPSPATPGVFGQPILAADGRILGTFLVRRSVGIPPSQLDLRVIRQSAGLAAVALERAQHNEDRRLAKVVFEQSIEGIMVTDLADRVLMVNDAFEVLTGFPAAEVVGKPPEFLDPTRDNAASRAERENALARIGRWSGELWGRRKGGDNYPLALSIATVNDAGGAPSHHISIMTDVSEQKIQAARIEQLAFYDSLTGLPNRALFLDRLEHTLAASRRHGSHGAILFLDLDRFKEINDSQGHAVGDLALAEVARRLQGASRNEETLARLGGDEFVLIAENADLQSATRIANRLQRSLAEPLELGDHTYSVGASIGIAFYPSDGQTSEDLIKRTDIAMYEAKASGGGYRLYQPEMGAELDKRLKLAKRLASALHNGELQLFYQPQIDLTSGSVIGAEALLRWHDPELGWISPAEFIPIAEERGMMVQLGDWVLAEACRQINAWTEAGLRLNGRLAVNVSALQMEDPDIVGRILEIVHEAGLSPDNFELELTESSMMVDPERAVDVLELLSAAGFGLSIDDFGTGYSSLSYLKRFAADQIKIDISFVRNMLTDSNDYTIVTTIIAMARSLGLKTTAEGVEEAGQADALLVLGCNSAQGYHFGRPEAPATFSEKWLKPSTSA